MTDDAQPQGTPIVEPIETPTDWRSSLPEEIREAPSLLKYKDLSGLANAYLSAEKMISSKHLPVPETDDEYNKVYSALGRPETADGYQFGLPEGLQADWIKENIDENWEKQFKEEAHRLGLSAKQATSLRDKFIKDAYTSTAHNKETSEAYTKEANALLRKEWGNAYDNRVKAASLVVELADSSGSFGKFLKESGLSTHPEMVRFLGNLGIQTIDDENLVGDKPGMGRTPEQITAEIASIQSTPAYMDGSNPQHRFMVSKMESLYSELHAE